MGIYTVRTTVGRENSVISMIKERIEEKDIKAMIHPDKLKGYILVEGDKDSIKSIVNNLRHSKGMIEKPVDISEVEHFIESKKIEITLNRGDIIEVVGGPFKGQKGKITRVDKKKAEVTLELLEAAVPIPVTVGVDSIKVIEKNE